MPGTNEFGLCHPRTIVKPKRRVWTLPAALLLTGCSHIATVRQTDPQFSVVGAPEPSLIPATRQLADAQKRRSNDPPLALGEYLASAQAAYERLCRVPSDTQARDLYNFAVARSIGVIETARLNPWDRTLTVLAPDGYYSLTAVRHPGPDRNPADYELIPADSIITGGTFLQGRVTVGGVGAPVVAIGREEKKDFRQKFTSRRLYGTATAVIRFQGHSAKIEFLEPFTFERVTLGNRVFPLAADFTAATAVGLVREHPEKLGLIRMLRPEKYADTARLTRLQVYDPRRIPVIFVHGLQDTPASWVPMLNTLREDAEIRRRYQFWVYSYPSGYAYPYSAALLRKELDDVGKAFPDCKSVILVGHSMGGIISRLMITDAGDRIWRDYFGKSPSEMQLTGRTREILQESLIFNHRPEVKRVIFLSAPHRGSDLATNWIGRVGARLVSLPFRIVAIPIAVLSDLSSGPGVLHLNRLPNSIDTLAPNNRFVLEVNKIPITPDIPYHSIIGDRGRGDTPHSSDGVVAYWSSHLNGARSELIVPSNHSTPRSPQAIAEVRRILKENH